MAVIWFNDNDPNACAILREMMADGLISEGTVDDRSIIDVQGRELERYARVHLFAGIGGFEIAAQLAGWPDDRTLWTGGFPCQPFSAAGSQQGTSDDRYLWPEFHRLLRTGRPEFVLVENVPGIDGETDMVLDRVCADLESLGYETWPCEIPACAVDAAHLRNRVWIVAHHNSARTSGHSTSGPRQTHAINGGSSDGAVEHASRDGRPQGRAGTDIRGGRDAAAGAGALGWIACHDGKLRRLPLGLLDSAVCLADGLPSRRIALHGLGNAIVPQVAAEILVGMLRAA